MSVEDRPEPVLGPRDVLIDVRAASLNPIDFKVREGKTKLVLKTSFPIGLGCDVAGVVSKVGTEVKGFRPGDEVCARLEENRMGGLAEKVAADEYVVARKPKNISFAEAAALPLTGLTALQALRDKAKLQPGQHVLIHAGAGGVGTMAIQIAKMMGLRVSTTASTKNADLVRSLGADDVIDYTKEDVAARARGVDAVFDTLGDASELTSLQLVRPGGVVVGVSGLPDSEFASKRLPFFVRPIIWLATMKRRRVAARTGARFEYLFMHPNGAELSELGAWVEEGRLRPVLHRTYPFAEIKEAFAELERGRARGKIAVEFG
jgi:alcohol dehydrogenase